MNKAFSHDRVTNGKDEWLTPPSLMKDLGDFDLDPCSPVVRPWPTAKTHLTINDNGLAHDWNGRVWLNPPYGTSTIKWMRKMAEHRHGIALIFARTETRTFFECVWGGAADAILFIRGRLTFHNVDGTLPKNTGGAPSCLVAYGDIDSAKLSWAGIDGQFVRLTPHKQ